MRNFSTLLMTMFAMGAVAQSGGTGALLDETYQLDASGDRLFHYVFAYDNAKQRSSETVYVKERTDGVWGKEQLYVVGNYSYQFDSKGRLKVKEVKYSSVKPEFQTYRIMVDYDDNAAQGEAVSKYSRYTLASDDSYQLDEQWSTYADGSLASHSVLNSYDAKSYRYDANGQERAILSYDYSSEQLVTNVAKSGTLNDSTIVHYENGKPSWTERYRFDSLTGRKLEYTTWGTHTDNFHNVWAYDAQGRIVLDEHYIDAADDDSDVAIGRQSARPSFLYRHDTKTRLSARKADAAARPKNDYNPTKEPEWKLDERITYKYYNDNVYGYMDSWRSVFEMEGPLAECVFLEKGDDEEPDYEERIVFTRDASGRLTAVNHTYGEEEGSENSSVYTVDAAGHITRRLFTNAQNDDSGTDTYVDDYQYVWEGDRCVSMLFTEAYNDHKPTKTSHIYTYDTATGKFTDQRSYTSYTWSDEPYTSSETFTLQQNGTSFEATNYQSDNYKSRYIREVQQEDVSFVRPNMLKDYDGTYPELRTVVSVKGRVVTTCSGNYGKWGYAYIPALDDADNEYLTTAPDHYFSVKRVGSQLVCSNFDGFPVYIVEDGRLVKERIYEDEPVSSSTPSYVAPAAEDALGKAYTEVEYKYAHNGLLVGQTVTEVSKDGARSENISIDYKYDETTGIAHYEATTSKMQLLGRNLGLTDGATFCVYTLGGTQLAANVSDYTFASSGVYVVKVGAKSVKLTVK